MNWLHTQNLVLSTLVLLSAPGVSFGQAIKPYNATPSSPLLSDLVPAFKTIPKDVLNIIARYLNAADILSRLRAAGIHEVAILEKQPHDHTVFASFSPDGRTVISPNSNQIQAWDAHSGKRLAPLITIQQKKPLINEAYYNQKGTHILFTWDSNAVLHDLKTQKNFTFQAHSGTVKSAKFHPDDTHIVTASADRTARIWNSKQDSIVGRLAHTETVKAATFSTDGTRIITISDDHKARVWNTLKGSLLLTLLQDHLIHNAIFHPEGAKIIASDWNNTLLVCDAVNGTVLHTLRGHTDKISSIVCSADGSTILSTSQDNKVRVWDAQTGNFLFESTWTYALSNPGSSCRVSSISLSPDNNNLVTAGSVIGARVWAPAFSTDIVTMEQVIFIKMLDKHIKEKPLQLETVAQQEHVDSKKLHQILLSFKDPQMRDGLVKIYGINT